jgi:hypothetical protein
MSSVSTIESFGEAVRSQLAVAASVTDHLLPADHGGRYAVQGRGVS